MFRLIDSNQTGRDNTTHYAILFTPGLMLPKLYLHFTLIQDINVYLIFRVCIFNIKIISILTIRAEQVGRNNTTHWALLFTLDLMLPKLYLHFILIQDINIQDMYIEYFEHAFFNTKRFSVPISRFKTNWQRQYYTLCSLVYAWSHVA